MFRHVLRNALLHQVLGFLAELPQPAGALGAGFLYWCVALLRGRNPRAPIETFRYSILYLALLFVALLVDHYVPIGVPVVHHALDLQAVSGPAA